MRDTLERYRGRICSGEIEPLVHWDGQTAGLIFDPADEDAPLSILGFGACRLTSERYRLKTGEREFAFVPLVGDFQIRVDQQVFRGSRPGPFATRPGSSNAYAVYAPAGSHVEVTGNGEVVYYTAPARTSKPPVMITPGQRPDVLCGAGVWLREVVALLSPEEVTTTLVVGETYSPPGLWSGSPLHVHDLDDPEHGQSDHEEVYFHVARHTGGEWGPYGVQLLFDSQGLNRAYVIGDHDAFAVPGAAHPVIAGPTCDMLYVWGLAGTGSSLKMRDVPEFAFLKRIGGVLDQLARTHPRPAVACSLVDRLVREAGFTPEQAHVLRMHLRQQGFEIVPRQ